MCTSKQLLMIVSVVLLIVGIILIVKNPPESGRSCARRTGIAFFILSALVIIYTILFNTGQYKKTA